MQLKVSYKPKSASFCENHILFLDFIKVNFLLSGRFKNSVKFCALLEFKGAFGKHITFILGGEKTVYLRRIAQKLSDRIGASSDFLFLAQKRFALQCLNSSCIAWQ